MKTNKGLKELVKIQKRKNFTPHERFVNIIHSLKIKKHELFPDSTFFWVDEKILFEKNNKYNNLFYSQNYFSALFGLSQHDIIDVMENEIKTINKWKNLFVIEYDFFTIENIIKSWDDLKNFD